MKGSKGLVVFVVAAMADCIVVATEFDYYTHNLEILNLTDFSAVVHGFDRCIHRKITIIIERCNTSTSWGQISLFVIKEQIKSLFLYQCPVFRITL